MRLFLPSSLRPRGEPWRHALSGVPKVWKVEMAGECGVEDSRGEQIDIELLLRRARLCDHGLVTMDRVGDETWRGIPSGKNVIVGGARGAVPI